MKLINPKLIAQGNMGTIKTDRITRFAPDEPLQSVPTVDIIFSTLLGFLTIVGGLAFLIYFIIGALNWVMAGGDQKKVDTAKSYMTNGAIGMIIIVASYAIISIVGKVLGLDILNPGLLLNTIFPVS